MTKLIVANWKMNGSINKITTDITRYSITKQISNPRVVLAVPHIYFYQSIQIMKQNNAHFKLASQNISQFPDFGAYTGEISATMLKELSIEYVIIGHSERRTHFNESGSILLNKLENALLNNITPIFCIGENLVLRDTGNYADFLVQQLELLTQINLPLNNLVIAYEPIWAIGTGIIPTTLQISEIIKLIDAFVQNYLPHVKITILYGGSISAENACNILNLSGVGGVLVGGSSLKTDDFIKICES